MPAPISVNLLPKDAFLDSIVGKFLLWSLSIGRYLVVFTELIVILSFLSRFKLDRDLTDLNEKIQIQKQAILAYADTETKFNAVKNRIDAIKRNQENQYGVSSLNFLEQNIPIDVKLSRLNFNSAGWAIEWSALSAQSLKLTVSRIVAANPQSDVSLANVRLNSQTGAIDFNLAVRHSTRAESVKPSKIQEE